MTLVIVDIDHNVPTLWANLETASLDQAVLALAKREGVSNPRAIGRWPNNTQNQYRHQAKIAEWAANKGLTGVIWTALLPGMQTSRGVLPTITEVKNHLAELNDTERAGAIEYIHRAPRQIATPYRLELEDSFPMQDVQAGDND